MPPPLISVVLPDSVQPLLIVKVPKFMIPPPKPRPSAVLAELPDTLPPLIVIVPALSMLPPKPTHGGPAVRLDGDPEELTALHWASASGNVEAVRFLLAPPVAADPRAARNNNFTPLHAAAMQGHHLARYAAQWVLENA